MCQLSSDWLGAPLVDAGYVLEGRKAGRPTKGAKASVTRNQSAWDMRRLYNSLFWESEG